MLLQVKEWMHRQSGVPMEDLEAHMFLLRDRDATQHLMEVAGGLDSLIKGEGQILAQARLYCMCTVASVAPRRPSVTRLIARTLCLCWPRFPNTVVVGSLLCLRLDWDMHTRDAVARSNRREYKVCRRPATSRTHPHCSARTVDKKSPGYAPGTLQGLNLPFPLRR